MFGLEGKTNSIKKATAFNAISKYSQVCVQLVVMVVLARLLSPYDYGIAAIVTVFTTLFSILADMGIGPAIIQDKTLTKKETSSLFTLTIPLGVALGVLFVLVSSALAFFYTDQIYFSLSQLLAASVFFQTASIVPRAVILKEKRFFSAAVRVVLSAS